MKQILWPESGKSFSREFDLYVHRMWAHSAWVKVIMVAVIAISVISGIGWLFFGWVIARLTALESVKEVKSTSWPGVEATIKSSGVVFTDGRKGYPDYDSADWYQAWSRYEYAVGGASYKSSEDVGGSFSEVLLPLRT